MCINLFVLYYVDSMNMLWEIGKCYEMEMGNGKWEMRGRMNVCMNERERERERKR